MNAQDRSALPAQRCMYSFPLPFSQITTHFTEINNPNFLPPFFRWEVWGASLPGFQLRVSQGQNQGGAGRAPPGALGKPASGLLRAQNSGPGVPVTEAPASRPLLSAEGHSQLPGLPALLGPWASPSRPALLTLCGSRLQLKDVLCSQRRMCVAKPHLIIPENLPN